MEIKHTIEILTKDIQDIEKLVRNLNNYDTPPQIELDLAMSKLRNVYDLLSMISRDSLEDLSGVSEAAVHDQPETAFKEEAIPAEEEPTLSDEGVSFSESEEEHIDIPEEEGIPFPEEERTPEAHFENPDTDQTVEEDAGAPPEQKPKEASILAEKFIKDKSLNEKIATSSNPDLGSKVKGGPIDSIKRNIGINDRFMIIRELMNGDNEGFNQLIQKLDDCSNFNDAFTHIQKRFPDNLEHDGVKILINLTRRKFISGGNV